jgi:transposase
VVNAMKAAVLTAPEPVRAPLKGLATTDLITRCLRLRTHPGQDLETAHTLACLRLMAKRYQNFNAEIAEHDTALAELVQLACPQLLDLFGVGPITAAALLTGWSYPGRIHSDAAFAMLSGVAPIPASSGNRQRVRLNRGGDRALNKALHTIAITRLRGHAETQAYIERRISEGKTRKEAIRCLKRYLARRIFKYLEHHAQPPH